MKKRLIRLTVSQDWSLRCESEGMEARTTESLYLNLQVGGKASTLRIAIHFIHLYYLHIYIFLN